jgi:GNAT superfamily N-acetyltransferase
MPVDISISDVVPELDLFDRTVREQRNKRHDTVLIAFHATEPIGYLFATKKDCWVSEIEDWLIIKPHEVYFYDAFTHPAHRGNRIYPTLLNRAANHFQQQGYAYALVFTSARNAASVKGIEYGGFSEYGSIQHVKLLGMNIWDFTTRERYVASHFRNEA